MIGIYLLLVLAGFYTGTATWYRARNSKKELNLKTASIKLQIIQLREKYGDKLKDELEEISLLIGS
jgi:hypothetical protein